jgi:hypothetical protein
MLVATFGPTTTWVGKTITFEDDTFVLQDRGPISAGDVMRYDQQGHLVWENDGTRAWVGSKAQGAAVSAPVAAEPTSPTNETLAKPLCRKCGASVGEAKFCPECGAPTSEETPAPQAAAGPSPTFQPTIAPVTAAASSPSPTSRPAVGAKPRPTVGAKPKKKVSKMGCGCLTLIVVVVAIIVVVAVSGHKTGAQQASSYITAHSSDISGVQASVQAVKADITANASMDQLAQDAQQAHDNLDGVRDDFAVNTTTSGTLGDDETEVFGAANDLKNAMGALVAYTGNSNPATLAQFKTQYQNAVGEWNDGVSGVWSLAGKMNAPTI